MSKIVSSVVPKRGKGIRVSIDREMPDVNALMVKGVVMRFSSEFVEETRMNERSYVQTFVLDDGEWGVAVLPDTTNSRDGYAVHRSSAGLQATCDHQRKRGLQEGIYLLGAPFAYKHKGDDLDVYPMEWVKNVR